jgi:hypothetical protein
MDNQQQQGINEAAQQFTNALIAAYRTTSGQTRATQELGARLTEHFFKSVVNNLRTQAEGTRQVTQQLTNQQQRAQKVTRELAQASTNTYIHLLDSVFSLYQGGTSVAKRRTEETERRIQEAESRAQEAERQAQEAESRAEDAERQAQKAESSRSDAESRAQEAESSNIEAENQRDNDLPLTEYDSLNVRQISERLNELSVEEIRRLRDYEASNKNRKSLLRQLDLRIETAT